MSTDDIDTTAQPTGTGCVECIAAEGWWLHLRRCARCGHIGCCDTSPRQHASAHAALDGHSIARSFEPDEDWFWDYTAQRYIGGPRLPDPQSRPLTQPVPGPLGRVPPDWRRQLH
jgi:hypothetical protein